MRSWQWAAVGGAISSWLVLREVQHRKARQAWQAREGKSWAVVTGASAGMGEQFAWQLAHRGYHVMLVARRTEKLEALASAIRQQTGVQTTVFTADLANAEDVARLEAAVAALPNLGVLVNNAGFGTGGDFAFSPLQPELDMLRVHAEASMRLARAALPVMIARRQGGIINVSSLAAFLPMPKNIVYGSTKAFLNAFSEALSMEVAQYGVRVQALCPGFTYSEFHDRLDFDRSRFPNWLWMSSADVVTASLAALAEDRVVFVPGFINRMLVALMTLLPFNGMHSLGNLVRQIIK